MKTCLRVLFSTLCLGLCLNPPGVRAATVNLPVVADTFIINSGPDNNAGANGRLNVGMDGVGGLRRGLLRFNTGSILPGATVTSAVLKLTVIVVPITGSVDSSFEIYRLLADWTAGSQFGNSGSPAADGEATWNSRMHGVAGWTDPGAASDAAATASASTFVDSTPAVTYEWTGAGVVSDVQHWVDNPGQNFGWLLRSNDEASAKTARAFAALENGAGFGTLQVSFIPAPNMPPTVAISSPTNGAAFTTGAVAIVVSAMDPDGSVASVQFFDGAVSLGSDNSDPFGITALFTNGSHTLTAVATDDQGASTTSSPVSITVTGVAIANPIPERIPKGTLSLELQTIADGMAAPLAMTAPDDGTGRILVCDQSGLIWIVTPAGRLATPLADLRSRLIIPARFDYDERGLLGLAAHPNFAANPLLYIYTSEPNSGPADFPTILNPGTTNNHQAVIAEWRIDPANTNQLDPASRREVLRIDEPQSNHNGGSMIFGPDGFLYITLGDGGSANDVANGHLPGGNAQNLTNILGKILRIDVDTRNSANGKYGLPSDNPFDGTNGLREIWAYGLRNAFNFSFDRMTGTLYAGDVGQNRVEEIDIIVKGGNYGWNIREGAFWFDSSIGQIVTAPVRPVPPNLIDPIAQYDHDDGLSIIGGYIYRGAAIPELQGRYVFADWGSFNAPSGRLYYLDTGNVIREFRLGLNDRPLGFWVRGFGEGPDGELYVFCSRVVGPAGNTGKMFKIIPNPKPISITSIAPTNGTNVAEMWCGGLGPYALQKKANLNDPTWFNAAIATQTNSIQTMDTPAGFFRVSDTARQRPIPLSAHLSGAHERPTPLVNSAEGFGLFSLDGNTLTFNVRYAGLSGVATMAHIHGPAPASGTAGVIIDLAPFNGGAFGSNGSLSAQVVISDAHKAIILAGRSYVNLHTAANPGGEVRGQIAPVLMQVSLHGANERPTPVSTPAQGLGVLMLVSNQLTFNITYRGLSGPANAAHIHGPATMSEAIGVLVDLAPYHGGAFGASGRLAGTIHLTPAQLASVIDGLTYVNLHTPANGGGEIRGQIVPQATAVPFTAPLTGLSELPTPITNNASGEGFFSLEGELLTFSISYSNLSGVGIAAHLHGPATTTNSTGIQVDLAPYNGGAFGASGALAGTVLLTPAQRDMVLNGQMYVNVHTPANSSGEIRGHVAPVLMQSYLSGASERPTPVFTSGNGLANLALVLNQLNFNLTYRNLSGTATDAHIHGPAAVNQSAGVLIPLGPFNGGAFGAAGSLVGQVVLTTQQLGYIVDQRTYFNVHTPANSGGEIRGHINR